MLKERLQQSIADKSKESRSNMEMLNTTKKKVTGKGVSVVLLSSSLSPTVQTNIL
jgi:hypothetical protein